MPSKKGKYPKATSVSSSSRMHATVSGADDKLVFSFEHLDLGDRYAHGGDTAGVHRSGGSADGVTAAAGIERAGWRIRPCTAEMDTAQMEHARAAVALTQ